MMRPDDIPEDIWNHAHKTWEAARLLTDKHGASVPETYTLLISRAIMAATERAAVAGDSLANDIQASAEEMRGEMRVHRLRRAAGIRHLVSILRNPAALAERVEAATREPQNDNFKSIPHNGEIG